MRHLFWGALALVLSASCQLPLVAQLNSPNDKKSSAYAAANASSRPLYTGIYFPLNSNIYSAKLDPATGLVFEVHAFLDTSGYGINRIMVDPTGTFLIGWNTGASSLAKGNALKAYDAMARAAAVAKPLPQVCWPSQ